MLVLIDFLNRITFAVILIYIQLTLYINHLHFIIVKQKANLTKLIHVIAFYTYSICSQLTCSYLFNLLIIITISCFNIICFESLFFTLLLQFLLGMHSLSFSISLWFYVKHINKDLKCDHKYLYLICIIVSCILFFVSFILLFNVLHIILTGKPYFTYIDPRMGLDYLLNPTPRGPQGPQGPQGPPGPQRPRNRPKNKPVPKEKRKQYREKNIERERANVRRYDAKHRLQKRLYNKAYREAKKNKNQNTDISNNDK